MSPASSLFLLSTFYLFIYELNCFIWHLYLHLFMYGPSDDRTPETPFVGLCERFSVGDPSHQSNTPDQSRSVSYLQQHTCDFSVCLSSCCCVSVTIAVLCFTTSLRRYHTEELQHLCWLSFKMWLEPYHAAKLKNMQMISKGTHTGSAKCPSNPHIRCLLWKSSPHDTVFSHQSNVDNSCVSVCNQSLKHSLWSSVSYALCKQSKQLQSRQVNLNLCNVCARGHRFQL